MVPSSWLATAALVLYRVTVSAHSNRLSTRSLDHCDTNARRDMSIDLAHKRRELVSKERVKRGIDPDERISRRSYYDALATDHNVTYTGFNLETKESTLFSFYDKICVLDLETTYGPYCLDLYLELQFIDASTCDPVPNVYIDIWHANTTGVYSGIHTDPSLDLPANGNTNDASNINTTFFRGIQNTDQFGVARFETKFPGHYALRATHVHVIVHENATVFPNGTLELGSGQLIHVGQVFFDQTLIADADTVYPYSDNTNTLILNSADPVFYQEADNMDPVAQYVYLGEQMSEGLMAWMAFGINTTSNYNDVVQEASFYGEDGGETNENYNVTELGSLGVVPANVSVPTTTITTIGL